MKIGEFLKNCNKEELPFYLYSGNNGYKIPCTECEFFKQNNFGIWKCTSMFLSTCQGEFGDWLNEEVGKSIKR